MIRSNVPQETMITTAWLKSLGLLVLVMSLVLGNASSAIAGVMHAIAQLGLGVKMKVAPHNGVAHAERQQGSKYRVAHEEKGNNYTYGNAGSGHAHHHSGSPRHSNRMLSMPSGDGKQENFNGQRTAIAPPVLGSPGTSQYVQQTWLPNAADDTITVTWSPDSFLQVDPSELTPGMPIIVSASLTADGGLTGTVELSARLDNYGTPQIETRLTGIFEGVRSQIVTHPNGVVSMQFQQPLLTWNVPGNTETFEIELHASINLEPQSQPPVSEFDGDGKSDISVYRPSNNSWYILNSFDNSFSNYTFGTAGDILAPSDFDGDGQADLAVFRPSSGYWYILQSSDNGFRAQQWGLSSDKLVPADYDGDSKVDLAVFRPSEGNWYILRSTGGASVQGWGDSNDRPVPADYDGDGKTDVAVFRPSSGYWYILQSSNNGFRAQPWGLSTDKPVPADYDADGKADLAVFRPSDSTWYILQSSDGSVVQQQFGSSGDVPVPSAYIPD